jgi:hypothetical protein
MYTLVLTLHSWLRWAALALGLTATAASLLGTSGSADGESWGAPLRREQGSDRWGLIFLIIVDVQMLLGLLMYFALSPFTTSALKDFAAAMRNPALRFWAVEHSSLMLLAVVLVHTGRVLARRARTPASRRLRQSVCFGLATLVMIVAIPWPGLPNGRPLLRL